MARMFVAIAGSVLVAAAGPSAGAALRPDTTARAALITKVKVTASEFKFVLSRKTAKRGIVIFTIKNVGKLQHDFKIKGRKTRLISPGKSATLRVVFVRKGHYSYMCTVPGHAAAGMKGVFTIT